MNELIRNDKLLVGIILALTLALSSQLFKFDISHYSLWTTIDAFATLLTLFLVYMDYKQNRKKLEEITIKLQFPDGTTKSLFPIKRKNFSRAELKGILQDYHDSKQGFYSLRYMKEKEFIDKIFDIQDGKGSEFVMKIYEDDFFKLKE